MIVYIDESGDTGRKFDKGSSPFFVIAMIYFENDETRKRIIRSMENLKTELKAKKDFEFHLKSNTNNQKSAFLELIKKMDFNFSAVILNKKVNHYTNRKDMYIKSLRILLRHSKISNQISKIIFDEFFRRSDIHTVEKAILPAAKMKTGKKIRIYQKDSQKSNPIQIADYVGGIITKWINHKEGCEQLFEYIQRKQEIIIMK